MISILLPIHKPHVDNIRSGKKREEIRRKAPSCDPPFKCFIYETQKHGGAGKIVGEFICRKVNSYAPDFLFLSRDVRADLICQLIERSCLSYNDLCAYAQNERFRGLAISNVSFYDKSKKLSDFSKIGFDKVTPLRYPPQTWCYDYEINKSEPAKG